MKKRWSVVVVVVLLTAVFAFQSVAFAQSPEPQWDQQIEEESVADALLVEPEEETAVEASPQEDEFLGWVDNLTAECTAYNTVKLSWKAADNATGYAIYRSTQKTDGYKKIGTATEPVYLDEGLKTGNTYYYKVQPLLNEKEGELSDIAAVKVILPKITGVKAERVNYHSIRIKWNTVRGANKYIVYRSTKKDSGYKAIKTLGKASAYRDTNLATGKKYYYKVRACRLEYTGALSGPVSATATLDTLKGFRAKPAGVGSILLTWNKVSGANKYVIYRAKSEFAVWGGMEGEYKKIASLSGAHSSFVDKTAKQGNTYFYTIVPYRTSAKGKLVGPVSAKAPVSASIQRFLDAARSHLGKPYVWGAKGPNSFDCSGFVYYSLNQSGYKISYMTSSMWTASKYTTITNSDELQAGDILCRNGHVAIYAGDNTTIEAVNAGVIQGGAYGLWGYECAKRLF